MRKCKKCGMEKPLEKFVKQGLWRRHTCTECWNEKQRTGKPNTGRFKKGHTPWIKGKKNVPKRNEPRYKKRERTRVGKHRQSAMYCEWVLATMKRDEYKCQECSETSDLVAHHIIPWDKDESKRFDLENGKTLCRSCHSRHHRKEEINNGYNNFLGITKSHNI